MAESNTLTFKGRPLMRKDNLIYYGSMADSHIIMIQILDYKKVGDTDVANKVSIQLQVTDPNVKGRAQIVELRVDAASKLRDVSLVINISSI